jgi:predicted site-specific integrase-resolvase
MALTMIIIAKNGERYYTLADCAKELGISRQRVGQYVNAGRIKREFITIDVERVPESELIKFKQTYGR